MNLINDVTASTVQRDASCILSKHLFTTNCTTTLSLFPFRKLVIKFLQQSCEGFLLNIPSLSSSTQFGKFRNIALQLIYFLGFGLGLQILIFNLHLKITGDFWISQSISAQPILSGYCCEDEIRGNFI